MSSPEFVGSTGCSERGSTVQWRETAPLCVAFALLFAVLYGGTSWWTTRLGTLPNWNLPFEARVPFVPSLCLVYMTITPALLLAPFVFRSRRAMAPLFVTLTAELFVACVFFVLVPQTVAWSRPPVTGWVAVPFAVADAMNLSYNQFPSLHVAFAFTAALAYSRRRGAIAKLAWIAWAFAVAGSAWLIWEHNLLDLAGGVALAGTAMAVLYTRVERGYDALAIELTCLAQCALFARRHLRYALIFVIIWGASIRRWRQTRVVRTGFCCAQWIDDLLDGDRPTDREPLLVVDDLLQQVETRRFAADELSQLTAWFVRDLEACDPRAVDTFVALVREMRRDRERALSRATWPEADLDDHHQRTFRCSVDLMLTATGCTARATDVPHLVDALAWCSVFRDLEDDLRAGIVNVPQEVVAAGSSAVDDWQRRSRLAALQALELSRAEVAAIGDARGRRILSIFQRSIERFAGKQRGRRGVQTSVGVREPQPTCPGSADFSPHEKGLR